MPKRGINIPILVFATLLLGAIILVGYGESRTPERFFTGSLLELLPVSGELPGWEMKLEPLATTIELQNVVKGKLNYDEAVYAIYRNGSRRVSIYAAYWAPGKMPIKEVGRHTPDVCWVNAGWHCTMRDTLPAMPLGAENRLDVSTEHRTFIAGPQTEHVVFWHLVGDRVYSYKTGGRPPWHAIFTDVLTWGLNQRREQFFVRISSDVALGEFSEADPVRVTVERLFAAAKTRKQAWHPAERERLWLTATMALSK